MQLLESVTIIFFLIFKLSIGIKYHRMHLKKTIILLIVMSNAIPIIQKLSLYTSRI